MNTISDYRKIYLKTFNGSLVFIGRDDEYLTLKILVLEGLKSEVSIPLVDENCKIPDAYELWGRWDHYLKIVGHRFSDGDATVFKVYKTPYNDILIQVFK